jgi:hypothetical protein
MIVSMVDSFHGKLPIYFEKYEKKRRTALSQTMRTEPLFCHCSTELKSAAAAEFERISGLKLWIHTKLLRQMILLCNDIVLMRLRVMY